VSLSQLIKALSCFFYCRESMRDMRMGLLPARVPVAVAAAVAALWQLQLQ
jgi:hypothetical protein